MIAAGALALPSDLARRIRDTEIARLVGYPTRRLPAGRVRLLAAASREWYEANGRPWVFVRPVTVIDNDGEIASLEGATQLTSRALARRLLDAGATKLILAALSAGAEVDAESAQLWQLDRPDESYLLDRFGVAVVEYLAGWTGHRLRMVAARGGLDALPGYSPGYDGWALEDQPRIVGKLTDSGSLALPGPLEVFTSGMLRPKNSLFTVFALTPHRDIAEAAWKRTPCTCCSMTLCDHRRSRGSLDASRLPTLDDLPVSSATASAARSKDS